MFDSSSRFSYLFSLGSAVLLLLTFSTAIKLLSSSSLEEGNAEDGSHKEITSKTTSCNTQIENEYISNSLSAAF
jgi:hypothetical protein